MKIVLDTNILLISISPRSPFNWIFQRLIDEEYIICVTTEILNEYAEILERHMGLEVAKSALKTLINLPNLRKIEIFYNWDLLKDPDDNKFVDCAISANAKFLVSHDSDFRILSRTPFPKVEVISAEQFKKELDNQT